MRFNQRFQKLKAKKEILEKDIDLIQEKLYTLEQEKLASQEAKAILQVAAKQTQKNIEIHFSDLITKALHIVFDSPYTFVPEFVERRNKTECDFWLVQNANKLKPKFTVGGGVLDITSFALRLSYWKLEKGAPILILDEPFKNLSSNLLPKAIQMLKHLSDIFKLQIIIVTHSKEIMNHADRLFHVEQGNVIQIV